jgi:hypothetical protein
MKEYYILKNGGWPFIVEIYNEDNKFIIKENNDKAKTIYKSSFLKKFLGKNTNGKDVGNSILFLISINANKTIYKYLYIGSEIYSFTSDIPITKYYSPIGNSDTSYPYAKNKYDTFIMLDKCIIDNDLIDEEDDVYGFYYKTSMNKKNKVVYDKFDDLKIIVKEY